MFDPTPQKVTSKNQPCGRPQKTASWGKLVLSPTAHEQNLMFLVYNNVLILHLKVLLLFILRSDTQPKTQLSSDEKLDA